MKEAGNSKETNGRDRQRIVKDREKVTMKWIKRNKKEECNE